MSSRPSTARRPRRPTVCSRGPSSSAAPPPRSPSRMLAPSRRGSCQSQRAAGHHVSHPRALHASSRIPMRTSVRTSTGAPASGAGIGGHRLVVAHSHGSWRHRPYGEWAEMWIGGPHHRICSSASGPKPGTRSSGGVEVAVRAPAPEVVERRIELALRMLELGAWVFPLAHGSEAAAHPQGQGRPRLPRRLPAPRPCADVPVEPGPAELRRRLPRGLGRHRPGPRRRIGGPPRLARGLAASLRAPRPARAVVHRQDAIRRSPRLLPLARRSLRAVAGDEMLGWTVRKPWKGYLVGPGSTEGPGRPTSLSASSTSSTCPKPGRTLRSGPTMATRSASADSATQPTSRSAVATPTCATRPACTRARYGIPTPSSRPCGRRRETRRAEDRRRGPPGHR